MPRMRDALAIIAKRFLPLAALLLAGVASLGSSASFICGFGESHDQSGDFSHRWHRGRGADLSLWTPDGVRIVFEDAGRIYVVDADGTELTSLSGSYEPAGPRSETTEIDFSPTLSPDGSRVAYSTLRYAKGELREHTYEIAIQPIDGSDRVRLTENDRDDIAPSWSPDGSLIAFLSSGAEWSDYRVFIVSPDGSGERLVAPSVPALCCALAWSRDGSRLAFASERRETGAAEFVEISGVSDPPKREVKVIPDFAFRRQSLYIAKADGSGVVELEWSENPNSPPNARYYNSQAPEESVSTFQWSPDGERLAFAASRYGDKDSIYVADADGANVRRIFDLAAISEIAGRDAHDNERITKIAWSTDGSRIEIDASVVRGGSYAPVVYSVSADGSDLRRLAESRIELSDRIRTGSGPKRMVRYGYNPNDAPERWRDVPPMETASRAPWSWSDGTVGWILTTALWGESTETILARVVKNSVVAANPPISEVVDAGAECSRNVGWRHSGLARDCRTLLEIRDALAGDAVLHWTGDRPISEWGGITVENGRVRALETVPGARLNGTMPPKIAELTELRTLNLEDNELIGEIPPELGGLSKLEALNLSGNKLVGEIPPELGDLSSLEELRLESNPLRGGIPPELGNLSNLRILRLGGYDSRINSAIPPELGNLENLEELSLVGASLSGGIPPELGNLSNLRVLNLRGGGGAGAGLTGPIPRELANLKNLEELRLRSNRLEGRAPPELGDLITERGDGSHSTRLRSVDFSDNRLTGCVPPKLESVWSFDADIPFCE